MEGKVERSSSVDGVHEDVGCRHYLDGRCLNGQNCHHLHRPAQICWYFQKGTCWFGDRCRNAHIPDPDMSEHRRGSAPALFARPRGDWTTSPRRGSEPSLVNSQTSFGHGRRGSEPLVTNTTTLERSFERLTTRIEEEDADTERMALSSRTDLHRPSPSQGVPAVNGDTQGPSEGVSSTGAAAAAAAAAVTSPRPHHNNAAAWQQSKDVVCGICMDKVYEKKDAQSRRFGILPNCSHAFCIECIVTWRKTKEFQEEVIKACPQCRVKSSFYIPNRYWVESGKPKEDLIKSFKERSGKLKCKFFSRDGSCPFESECIYSHEGRPGRPRRRMARLSVDDFEDGFHIMDYVISLMMGFHHDSDDDDYDDFLETLFLDEDDYEDFL
ncbi:makorin, ring finger protein, 4 isoform X2 [Engraulis encrasicolus]|uniref:makorin, ring finger protein, 4 isoform X2 n=1 Tax=Engraulis encrasicolus TaxID=184585 RepID=UPI002FD4675B